MSVTWNPGIATLARNNVIYFKSGPCNLYGGRTLTVSLREMQELVDCLKEYLELQS